MQLLAGDRGQGRLRKPKLVQVRKILAKLIALGNSESEFESGNPGDEQLPSSNWLRDVFDQSRPATLLAITSEPSVCLGEHEPGILATLDEAYVSLIEFSFESGDLIVRFLSRPKTGESMVHCRTIGPAGSRKDCAKQLTSLIVSRSGPFLKVLRFAQPNRSELWACLKFSSYESTFMSFL